NPKRLVVEQRNLAPMRRCDGGTFGVNGGNGRLQRVGTEAARWRSAFGERDALGDLVAVPQGAILLLQQDQVSVARDSRSAARLVQQHQRQQTHHFGIRQQVKMRRRRSSSISWSSTEASLTWASI